MVEQHSAMRFAWLLGRDGSEPTSAMSLAGRTLFIAYNAVWWVPVVLAVVGVVSYQSAYVGFLVITVFRALVNLYRTNVLSVEAAQNFPLRSP